MVKVHIFMFLLQYMINVCVITQIENEPELPFDAVSLTHHKPNSFQVRRPCPLLHHVTCKCWSMEKEDINTKNAPHPHGGGGGVLPLLYDSILWFLLIWQLQMQIMSNKKGSFHQNLSKSLKVVIKLSCWKLYECYYII